MAACFNQESLTRPLALLLDRVRLIWYYGIDSARLAWRCGTDEP